MLVTVKRIERNLGWGAKDTKTGKIKGKFDNCFDKWVPGLDSNSRIPNTISTGLTEVDQELLEKKLNLNDGDLSQRSPYWDNFKIIIPEEGLKLNTADPGDELQYLLLKNDPAISESLEAAALNAKAEYVITSNQAEAATKNNSRNVLTKAYTTFGKLSDGDVKDALYMFGVVPDETSIDVCKNVLGELLEKSPAKFMSLIGDKQFKEKVGLIKLIRMGAVKKSHNGVGYDMPLLYGDVLLGNGLTEAVAFLADPENQMIYAALKKELKKA